MSKQTNTTAVKPSNKFQKYADLGLLQSLLPIIPPDGKLSPYSKLDQSHLGKIPGKMTDQVDNLWSGFTGWSNHETSETDIANWTSWPCGIGLQSRYRPGIDIDVNNPNIVDEIQEIVERELGKTAIRGRSGGSPRKILIYKLKDGVKPLPKDRVVFKDNTGMVEFLGCGQHYVIEGKHPKGDEYTNNLGETEIAEITVADVERVIAAIKDNFGTEDKKPTRTRKARAGRVYAETGSRSIETMQRIIQRWEPDTGRWDAIRDLIWGGVKDRGKKFGLLDAEGIMSLVPESKRDDTWDRYYNEIPNLVEGAFNRIEDKKASGNKPETISVEDLLGVDFPPMEWIVDSLLPAGSTLFFGKPKKGKSFLALLIAMYVAAGREVFGYATKPTRVLFLGLEDSNRRLQKRIKTIMNKSGITAKDICGNLVLQTEIPRLDEGFEQYIDNYLLDYPETRLIVVDVLQKVRSPKSKGNKYEEDYAIGSALSGISKKHPHVCFLVVHHSRKESSDDPFDGVSGTLGLTGGFDNLFALVDEGANRYLYLTGRDIEANEKIALSTDMQGFYTMGSDVESKEANMSDTRCRVYDAVCKGMAKPKMIVKDTGLSEPDVQQQLGKLQKDGLIYKPKRGMYEKTQLTKYFDNGSSKKSDKKSA